jgi:hypothetical protein
MKRERREVNEERTTEEGNKETTINNARLMGWETRETASLSHTMTCSQPESFR